MTAPQPFSPGWLALADQQCAHTRDNVTRIVAAYRAHLVDEHDDELSANAATCAWAMVGRVLHQLHDHPVHMADLVAACVDRIARLERELGR